MTRLTHLDDNGRASMVDVGGKPVTQRSATAGARVVMQPSTLALITEGKAPKGDVLGAARIAGIMAAKRTHELIPLCHPLGLDQVHVEFEPDRARASIVLSATVKVEGKTGVEMEAMVAVSIAALTIYDMCKGVDRAMEITDIRLMEKTGGKSGTYRHDHR